MDIDTEMAEAEMLSDPEDSSDSDFIEEETAPDHQGNEADLNARKEDLIQKIEKDKTDYYAYVELINVLTCLRDYEELRNIREKFSKQYPLSPNIWLAWIKDEQENLKDAADDEKRPIIEAIIDLFERALKDYQSVDIWSEYGQFSIGHAFERVRGIMERAVEKCGCNAGKGSLLWDLYRLFEGSVLETLPRSEENEDAIVKKKKNIFNLFRRQLSLPLLDMENTYQELKVWIDENDAHSLIDLSSLESYYTKAREKLSHLLPFEEKLLRCEADASLPVYRAYLDFEKNPEKGGNVQAHVICLYERALTDNPLTSDLWSHYMNYISELPIAPEDKEDVCKRAVRNCPGVVKFWIEQMIYLERRSRSEEEITELFNRALENSFPCASDYRSLWLYYVYYWRRVLIGVKDDTVRYNHCVEHVRTVIQMGCKNMNERFGYEGDPDYQLLLWWARFEAEIGKDLPQFRQIWSDVMESGLKKSTPHWIKYISMEWQYGDAKHMRKLCARALNCVTNNPKPITSLWLEYETMNGSLDSFLRCERVCQQKLDQYANEDRKLKGKLDSKKKNSPLKTDKKKGKGNAPAVSSAAVPAAAAAVVATSKTKPTTNVNHFPQDPSKNCRTVFISNLDYTVTEKEVIDILSNTGKVIEFRLVRDPDGRSLGYGYLVFSSKEEATEAVKLDRTPIKMRPMFISEYDPDQQSRKHGLRFSTGLEKHKLFVKGLPLTLDKAGVEKIFSAYGVLKDVRIVQYRNGYSKGSAYVEYKDEVSAAHALLKTDQLEVEGKVISVAISNPPEKKNVVDDIAFGEARVKDKSDFGPRGRGRTQLSFVPTILSVSKKPVESESNAMDVSEPASPVISNKALSNADFRNLLLSKK